MSASGVHLNGRFRASGPGPKTRDGCSVELYRRLPYLGEVELLKPWIAPRSSVLELGCGVGRVTRPLLAAGYRVTAVDNSAEMLAHAPAEAARILSDIEDLDLGEAFDAVVLGSCLINIPDEVIRIEQLARCRGHLRKEGVLLFERHDPEWLARVDVGAIGAIGAIAMSVLEARHRGDEVDLCFRYEDDGEVWLQHFTARILDDTAVALHLAGAGFGPPTWINRRWCAAPA
jgi:SAM-dependent methyltransferase